MLHARARIIQPGAARVEIRDTGTKPCGPRRDLASATPDAAGLTTVVVDIPTACQDTIPPDTMATVSFSRIVAIAYDRNGHEIGRAPIQSPHDGELPEAP